MRQYYNQAFCDGEYFGYLRRRTRMLVLNWIHGFGYETDRLPTALVERLCELA